MIWHKIIYRYIYIYMHSIYIYIYIYIYALYCTCIYIYIHLVIIYNQWYILHIVPSRPFIHKMTLMDFQWAACDGSWGRVPLVLSTTRNSLLGGCRSFGFRGSTFFWDLLDLMFVERCRNLQSYKNFTGDQTFHAPFGCEECRPLTKT